jgi:hypothetical protein
MTTMKNKAAQALVARRWAKTTKAERSRIGTKMILARWAKRDELAGKSTDSTTPQK